MKKMAVILVLIVAFGITGSSFAESPVTETVAQMSYSILMPAGLRAGEYTGQVIDGKPHGYGLFKSCNDDGENWYYIGQWANGKMNGQGSTFWEDGQVQTGEYMDNNAYNGYTSQPNLEIKVYFDRRKDTIDRQYNKMVHKETGNVIYEGYISLDGSFMTGTFYDKKGQVILAGEIGPGCTAAMLDAILKMGWQ